MSGDQELTAAAMDANGNGYVTGWFNYPIDLGSGLQPTGDGDVIVAALDPNLSVLWANSYGSVQQDMGLALTVTESHGVTLAGVVRGAVDFGVGTQSYGGAADGFLAQLDLTGQTTWSRTAGDEANQRILATVRATDGTLYVGGELSGTADLGTGPVSAVGGSADPGNAWLAAFEPDGTPRWASRHGNGTGRQLVQAMAACPDGTVVAVGSFEGSLVFGEQELLSVAAEDIFVVKLR